jgi:tyrosinase
VIQPFIYHITRRYWDWAEKDVAEKGLPPVLYEDKVEIMAAGGGKQTVDNPLSFFSFVGGIPSDFTDEADESVGHFPFSKLQNLLTYSR